MELEPGIHQLTFGREPIPGIPPPNSYLIAGTKAAILIDCGYDEIVDHQKRMAYLNAIGCPDVTELLLTHRHQDHAGGAALRSQETGISITCHIQERKSIESERLGGRAEVFTTFAGGEKQNLGGLSINIIHTPGHTLGSVSIYIPERNALLTADTVLGVTTSIVRPSEGDLGLYVKSLENLEVLNAQVIYPGHGPPITDPKSRIKMLLKHRLDREEALLQALSDGYNTIQGIRPMVYKNLPAGRERMAEEQVLSGLNKLIQEQRVASEEDRYTLL